MTGRTGECRRCAGPVYRTDRFCGSCGAPATEVKTVTVPGPGRNHAEIAGVVLITDRGLDHPDNEDAAVAGIVEGLGGHYPAAVAAATQRPQARPSSGSRRPRAAASTAYRR